MCCLFPSHVLSVYTPSSLQISCRPSFGTALLFHGAVRLPFRSQCPLPATLQWGPRAPKLGHHGALKASCGRSLHALPRRWLCGRASVCRHRRMAYEGPGRCRWNTARSSPSCHRQWQPVKRRMAGGTRVGGASTMPMALLLRQLPPSSQDTTRAAERRRACVGHRHSNCHPRSASMMTIATTTITPTSTPSPGCPHTHRHPLRPGRPQVRPGMGN